MPFIIFQIIVFVIFPTLILGQSEKPQTIIVPTGSLGDISEIRKKMLEKTLESALDDHFAIVPKDLFEEAQEKAFEELDYEECTEEQCIMMIKEILQVENAFQLVLMEEDGDTQISLTWNDLDQKRVEEEYCEGCKTKELRKLITVLVDKLVDKVRIPDEDNNQISSNESTNDNPTKNKIDEIIKEYNSIYSLGDTELLKGFINKYKSNDDVWWYVTRIENKLKDLNYVDNQNVDKKEKNKEDNNPRSTDTVSRITKRKAYLEYLEAKSANTVTALRQFISKYSTNSEAEKYIERAKKELKNLE